MIFDSGSVLCQSEWQKSTMRPGWNHASKRHNFLVGRAMQASIGHNYPNNRKLDNDTQNQDCHVSGEEGDEFLPLACRCPTLVSERLDAFRCLQPDQESPHLNSLLSFINMDHREQTLRGSLRKFIYECRHKRKGTNLHGNYFCHANTPPCAA